LSADPLPLSPPLIAAGVAALHAGLFACADTALTSLSAARLAALAKEATPRTKHNLDRAVADRPTIQARYLAGRVVSLCIAAGGMGIWLSSLHLDALLNAACAGSAILLMAIIIELAASLGRRAADSFVPLALLALWPYEMLVAPIAFLTGGFTYALKWGALNDPKITEAEVEIIVEQGEADGTIEHKDAELMRNVLDFSDLVARDAMIPRKKVIGIKSDTPLDEVLLTVTESGHSRYPVYRHDLDDIFGLLYAKDLFRIVRRSWRPPPANGAEDGKPPSQRSARMLDIVREPVKFVSESQPLPTLLQQMRQDRQHIAVVVDEYGGTSGVVTLEDVLEEIVGDIQDEYDHEEVPIVDLGQGRLIANASVLVSELSAYLGQELDPEERYDSLAGMLTEKIGSVPPEGTTVIMFGMRFIIRESDEKHIETVEIVRGRRADTSGAHRAAS
jgi:CBS domain containing-hemolysin-like protein